MEDKVSQYNVEVEHNDCMLLYNGLTDRLLPMSFEDYAIRHVCPNGQNQRY